MDAKKSRRSEKVVNEFPSRQTFSAKTAGSVVVRDTDKLFGAVLHPTFHDADRPPLTPPGVVTGIGTVV